MHAPVLLLDDSLDDAARLAAAIQENTEDLCSLESTQQVKQALFECGIDWFVNVSEAAEAIKQTNYQTFIIDIFIEDSSDNGLQLISRIRRHNQQAIIWLWSSKRYIQEKILVQIGADGFFRKTDMANLVNALKHQSMADEETEVKALRLKKQERTESSCIKILLQCRGSLADTCCICFKKARQSVHLWRSAAKTIF